MQSRKNRAWGYAGACCLVLSALTPLRAQEISAAPAEDASPKTTLVANLDATPVVEPLPDAPGFLKANESSSSADAGDEDGQLTQPRTPPGAKTHEVATLHTKIIQPDMTAPHLTAGDKVLLGLSNATSARALATWLAAALYEEAFDTAPNYGESAKGFAQRVGAAAARDSSETIFADSVLAPILHEDPRYYRLGPTHGLVSRVFYAATRTLVTRTDGGKPTPNFALVGGNLAGAALTQAYYPRINTGFRPTMVTFGTSLGGSSVGFVFDEFLRDALARFHHDRSAE